MTFSVAARCGKSGQFAVAVASSSPAVAARCAYARSGAGAVTTQNVTDPRLGPLGLDLMERGLSANAACEELQARAGHIEFRQLTLVDRHGRTAVYSGAQTLGRHASAQGRDVVAAGNMLAHEGVPAAIVAAFEAATDHDFASRILRAMQAGLAAGGEAGPIRSCGLVVVDEVAWPIADLRVDWHDAPLTALGELWSVWRPQMADYVTRALDPTAAPSYGVPGNE
jgi:uncharacterized Ntn-hydrolase superfamily protein